MAAFAGDEPRRTFAPVIIVGLIAALTIAVVAGTAIKEVALAVALSTVLIVGHRRLLAWRSLITALVLLIFVIPIKRYSLPASLPLSSSRTAFSWRFSSSSGSRRCSWTAESASSARCSMHRSR